MKKIVLYIIAILIIITITVGATYAFFNASVDSGNKDISNTAILEVVYTKGNAIQGDLNLVNSKEEGFDTTVMIKLSEESIDAVADLYIHINQISSSLATEALIWEVYKISGETETLINSGDFLDCDNNGTTKKCANGNKIYIVNDYKLSTNETYFKVYIWLNGNKIGNEVLGANLDAYIGAGTEKISGELK